MTENKSQIGFVYVDSQGDAITMTWPTNSGNELEDVFTACIKFIALIFSEKNAEDMILSEAALINDRIDREEALYNRADNGGEISTEGNDDPTHVICPVCESKLKLDEPGYDR